MVYKHWCEWCKADCIIVPDPPIVGVIRFQCPKCKVKYLRTIVNLQAEGQTK